MIAADRTVLDLIERTPDLAPGLSHRITDSRGHVWVHYAATRGSSDAAAILAVDGVLAAWTQALVGPDERDAESHDDEVTVHVHELVGSLHGHAITVIATIVGGGW